MRTILVGAALVALTVGASAQDKRRDEEHAGGALKPDIGRGAGEVAPLEESPAQDAEEEFHLVEPRAVDGRGMSNIMPSSGKLLTALFRLDVNYGGSSGYGRKYM